MREFFELCLTPPAWIFTWLMIPVSLYWLVSLFGSLTSHGADAGGHGHDGAWHDGHAGHDGHGPAGPDGHADHDGHHGRHGADGHGGDGGLAPADVPAAWGGLAYGEVPRILSLSLLVFFGWISSLAALWLYPPLAGIARSALWIGAGLSALVFVAAFAAAALAVRPIHRLLVAGAGPRRSDLIGKLCTVRTQRVDAAFGQAEVDHASSLVQVRDLAGRGLKYGDRALIFDYDSDKEVFLIAPFDPASPAFRRGDTP